MRSAPDKVEVGLMGGLFVFMLYWLGMVLLGDVSAVRDLIRQHRATQFTATTGRVTRCQPTQTLEKSSKGDWVRHGLDFQYEYRVAEKLFHGTRLRYGADRSGDAGWSAVAAHTHPPDSAITVFYDPARPEESLIEPGIDARDLFLFPPCAFTAIGLLAWRFLLGWVRDSYLRPETGGVKIISRGTQLRARLARLSPFMSAMGTMALLSIAATILTGGSFLQPTAMRAVALGWVCVLGAAGTVFLSLWLRNTRGREDLVIDKASSTITLPENFGRKSPLRIDVSDISAVELRESGQGKSYHCFPTLCFRNRTLPEARLAKWSDERKGRAFVGWLRARLETAGSFR